MKLVPLAHNSKSPLAGTDWHELIFDDALHQAECVRRGLNLGMPVEENDMVVVDFDDKERARDFYREHPHLCSVIVETRRGAHYYFSGHTKTRKFAHGDVKGNGYVVYPPSIVDGFKYEFVANGELQLFPEELFPPMQKSVTRGPIKNVKAYVMQIESIEGQNGSAGLVRFVSICRDNGVSEAQTMLWLLEWNKSPKVSPSWTDEELLRAITRGFQK